MPRLRPHFLQGQCLIASPSQAGTYFERTLILITHHEAGALGVVLNRPRAKETLRNYLEDFSLAPDIISTPIFEGGPVEKNLMSIIGFTYAQRRLSVQTHLTPPDAQKFWEAHHPHGLLRAYLGYAGWAPGQLEDEITRGDWRVTPLTPALLS